MGTKICVIVLAVIGCTFCRGQTTYFEFRSGTGLNATIMIPNDANPSINWAPLQPGDEIGIFADGVSNPDSFCVGATVWNDANTAITAWGDNDQTPELDGLRSGSVMHFHIWQKSTSFEYKDAIVSFSQGNGIFLPNAISILSNVICITTDVKTTRMSIPSRLVLEQNYPNPFNPTTIIRFGVPARLTVRISVFTTLGGLVVQLADGEVGPGYHEVQFDGSHLASGVYYYRIQAGDFAQTRSFLLLK